MKMKDDFIWGAASASYQVEGAVCEDGRGESIWDRYCSIPGNILDGDTGEIACDQYHRYREDIEIMRKLGIQSYRFSVAWPRIIPDGNGDVNQKGIDYYIAFADALLEAGIEPMVTLYHWDLPQALQDMGGWTNRASSDWFARYAEAVFKALDGRVRYWITLNEPYCASMLGNYEGRMAPGLHDFSSALLAAYNMYVGHGKAVRLFRDLGISGSIGIALNLMGRLPYSDKPEDIEAARIADGYLNRWFAEPILIGKYPEDMIIHYRKNGVRLPEFRSEDLALMSQMLDFTGLNYYNDFNVRASDKWPIFFEIRNHKEDPVNARNWPVTEDGFESMLLRMTDEWGVNKILITENGTAELDRISLDGCVHDYNRIDYLVRHIKAMERAIGRGADVIGYTLWSLTDNLEWAFGYSSRFGIVYIDFPTQKRIIKDSGYFYSSVIRNNGLED